MAQVFQTPDIENDDWFESVLPDYFYNFRSLMVINLTWNKNNEILLADRSKFGRLFGLVGKGIAIS